VKKRGECKIAVPDETVTLVEDKTPKAELIISLDELGVSKSKSKLNGGCSRCGSIMHNFI
jgi:hypothetical protein